MTTVKVQPWEVQEATDHARATTRSRAATLHCVTCGDVAHAVMGERGVLRAFCEAHLERPGQIEAPCAPEWTKDARCAGHEPPSTRRRERRWIATYCTRCPVTDLCAAYAVRADARMEEADHRRGYGEPMGGLSALERRGLTEEEAVALSRARLFEIAMKEIT